jgi:hypothetical protein
MRAGELFEEHAGLRLSAQSDSFSFCTDGNQSKGKALLLSEGYRGGAEKQQDEKGYPK